MKAMYFNTDEQQEPQIIDIEDKIDNYYKLINCDCIDIVCREIGNKTYNIVCDDEGILKGKRITATSSTEETILVGNLIIYSGKITDDGELIEISEEEIENLKKYIFKIQNRYFLLIKDF